MYANYMKYIETYAAYGPQEPKISLKLMTKDQMYYGRLWLFQK